MLVQGPRFTGQIFVHCARHRSDQAERIKTELAILQAEEGYSGMIAQDKARQETIDILLRTIPAQQLARIFREAVLKTVPMIELRPASRKHALQEKAEKVFNRLISVLPAPIYSVLLKFITPSPVKPGGPSLKFSNHGYLAIIDYKENHNLRHALAKAITAQGVPFFDTNGDTVVQSDREAAIAQFRIMAGKKLEETIGEILTKRGLLLATAESCTGGLVSSRLTDVAGSSQYIVMNAVTYSDAAKRNVLRVSQKTLDQHGAVSYQTASEMADGIVKYTGANVGLSITGFADDEGAGNLPGGTVFIGLAGLSPQPVVKKVILPKCRSREEYKRFFSEYALEYLQGYLEGAITSDFPAWPNASTPSNPLSAA